MLLLRRRQPIVMTVAFVIVVLLPLEGRKEEDECEFSSLFLALERVLFVKNSPPPRK
jgi:hypothetical protein